MLNEIDTDYILIRDGQTETYIYQDEEGSAEAMWSTAVAYAAATPGYRAESPGWEGVDKCAFARDVEKIN